MNRLSRVGIAVALLAGVLWAGGVAEARRLPNAVVVCVDASSGVASRVTSSAKCVGGKQFWSASKSAPLLCWNASSIRPLDQTRLVSVAPVSGCAAPLRSVPVNKVLLLCADGKSGVLRWPVTRACASGNRQTWIRSAATVAPTTTTVAPTTSTTVAPTTSTTVAPTTTTTVAPTTTVALTCAAGGVCAVGDTGPGGGKVFYVHASGTFACGATLSQTCKYLEVAPNTWSGGTVDPPKLWATATHQSTDITSIQNDSVPSNNALGIGLGYKNSLAIVGQGNDTTTAAGAARAYAGGSQSDWYLPTTAELNLLCQWAGNVAQSVTTRCTGVDLNTGTGASGGFSNTYYLSSSEMDATEAFEQDFTTGGQGHIPKNFGADSVRPVRAF